MFNQGLVSIAALVVVMFLITGCSSDSSDTEVVPELMPAWVSQFDSSALIRAPQLVDCVLSGGEETRCVALTIPVAPSTIRVGPWCPRNVSDSAETAGIWLESGKVYDVDGDFIKNLATFYDDPIWQLYDESTGKVKVTDSKASCQAAARPDVDEAYHNYCVECQTSYLDEGKVQTFIIPVEPQESGEKQPRVGHDGVGVALSGVRLDAAAPVQAILSAHTLAPFDDCGGHVNMAAGYHIHAVTDCLRVVNSGIQHAPVLGIALDGYTIRSRVNADNIEPVDLDSCRGHSTSEIGYHYHAGSAGSNAIIGCHSAQIGCVLDGATTSCDATQNRRRRPPPPSE